MIQRPKQPRLALEPGQPVGIRRKDRRNDLDGHLASKLRIVREIHLTHPARA